MYCLDLEGFTASRLLAAITLFALADSLLSPDVLNCVTKGKHQQGTMDVAHLKSKKLLSLSPPVIPTPRIRPAAHTMTTTQLDDLKKGIEKMRALSDDDPRSLYQQANVHCAHCNDASF